MTKQKTEKVTQFGSFIPEVAKGLPADLDFSPAYLFEERNTVLAWTNIMQGASYPRLYRDARTLGCVRTILAGKQWDDPGAKKYVERYTGKWDDVKRINLSSKTIDELIGAIEASEKAKIKVNTAIHRFQTEQFMGDNRKS